MGLGTIFARLGSHDAWYLEDKRGRVLKLDGRHLKSNGDIVTWTQVSLAAIEYFRALYAGKCSEEFSRRVYEDFKKASKHLGMQQDNILRASPSATGPLSDSGCWLSDWQDW